MRRDPDVLLMGEDIAGDFGGAFKVTRGLSAEFGPLRVMNTPLAELGFTGMAAGMALMGLRPVVEMQFADFISSAFDSIVQFAATTHYRWGGAVPIVIRAPSDGGLRSGPFHSQNPEAWFVHTPGLKVVAPATPADAKGLLIAAIRDNNPVIYFESKPLYRSLKGYVPPGEHVVPIGAAHLARAVATISRSSPTAPCCTRRWPRPSASPAKARSATCWICARSSRWTRMPFSPARQDRQGADRPRGESTGRAGRRAGRADRRAGV